MRRYQSLMRKALIRTAIAMMATAGLVVMPASVDTSHARPIATAVVHWGALRQQIVGFGGSGAFSQAEILQYMPADAQRKILSLLFSPKDGIGLTIVRSLVNDGVDGKTIEPAPGQWDWNIQPDDQIWLMQQALKYGATTLMATPWSPPAWMKENNSVVGTGQQNKDPKNVLKPSEYHDYAVYLAKYVTGYWQHFHIHIDVISLQNEPNWDATYASCLWTPQQLDTFIREDLIPVFKQYHVTAKVMMPEELDWSENYALPTLNDPVASKAVSIVAAHGYAGTVAPLPVAQREHKQIWETEISTFTKNDPSIQDGLHWAEVVNNYLTVANVNAWNYWWLITNSSDNEGLVTITAALEGKYTVNKRLYTIGNYSRFVRPGFYRLGAFRNPASGVYLSAFKDPKTDHFAVVVVNENKDPQPLRIHMEGLTNGPSTVTPYVTSATQNLQAQPAIPLNARAFTATLAPESVTTFVGN